MSRFGDILGGINAVVSHPFDTLEAVLDYYRRELPRRVGSYRQDEVGPIMHHDDDEEAADHFVEGLFHLGQETLDMSGGLNWYGTPSGDLEWNGGLVRHGYFMLLADAYRETGDEKYARTVVEHMLDYIERVPPFDPDGKPYLEYKRSTWRPFEAAGRAAENWPVALARVISSPAMTPERWGVILLSVHEHARFLRKRHWKTGNHATLEVAALGIIGTFFFDFSDAPAWRTYAVEFLMGMWDVLFHADGYSKEMSGAYHWVAMRSFFAFYEVAGNNGYGDLFPPEYAEWLLVTSRAELYQQKPDYSVPVTNDSNSRTNRREQIERIDRFFDLADFRYRLSEGVAGTAPEHTSYYYPSSGIAIMRGDWTERSPYLFFDMGRWGDNHMNEDQLHVEISAYGRNFLVASGRWRYTTSDPSAPWMGWARYFKTTEAYNAVLVDGYCQVPGDATGTMTSSRTFDYAAATFSAGYGVERTQTDEKLLLSSGITTTKELIVDDVVHRRTVFFAKPYFWIIRDDMESRGEHTYEQVWHYREGALIERERGAWTTDFPDANLWMVCAAAEGDGEVVSSYFHGQEDPIRGWHCPYYDIKEPAPELRFRRVAAGSTTFHALAYPYEGRSDAAPPTFTVLENGYEVRMGAHSRRIDVYRDRPWAVYDTP